MPYTDPLFNIVTVANEKPYRILSYDAEPSLTPEFRRQLAEDDEIYFLKTHEFPFDTYFDGEYVTRLVRHPGAALWSYYNYLLKLEQTPSTVEEIISGAAGIPWSQYTNAWLSAEQALQNRHIKIKYEDLVESEENLITRIQNWTGLPLKQPFGTFPDFQFWHQRSPDFYRSGQVDEWRNKLTPEQIMLLYQNHAESAAREGYTFDFAPPPFPVDYETRIRLARLGMVDVANLPKVENAGQIIESGPLRYQVMFNGVKAPADSYYGPWYSDLIGQCQGHHEPQEESVFNAIVSRAPEGAAMMELGSYWAFYSAWFLTHVRNSRAVLVEPDPDNIIVSLATLSLNNCQAAVELAAVGERADVVQPISIGATQTDNFEAPLRSVDELMHAHSLDHLYLLHSDIQGAEAAMLDGAAEALASRRIDYILISTHSNKLHQACLTKLESYNYRVIAEHDTFESYTFDGLIVACSDQVLDAPALQIHKRTAAEWTWEEAAKTWENQERYLKPHFELLGQGATRLAREHIRQERDRLLEESKALKDELGRIQQAASQDEQLLQENSDLKNAFEGMQQVVSQRDQLLQENNDLKNALAELQQAIDQQREYIRSRKISRLMKLLGKPII